MFDILSSANRPHMYSIIAKQGNKQFNATLYPPFNFIIETIYRNKTNNIITIEFNIQLNIG